MINKPIQVTKSSMPPFKEYCEEIKPLWENRWLTNSGIKHQQFERLLKERLNVPSVQLFSNGHSALEIALSVLQIKGEVITTPFTFASTTQAVIRCGLTPVFCDIEPDTFCIDADKIEELITEKTCAILPVHVYGNICDYRKIQNIADRYHLKVIYDAAHAFYEECDGISTALMGDISMFSFHATKVFNTIEGGCLTYKNSDLDKEFNAIRQFGMYGKEDAEIIGTNAKMTEFQAAMGICNMRHIDEYIGNRQKCAERYRERLGEIKGIRLGKRQNNVKSNYSYIPVVFNDDFGSSRDEIAEKLAAENIYARKYFYPLTSDFSICKQLFGESVTPVASDIASKILTLPLYSDLYVHEVDRICDVILKK